MDGLLLVGSGLVLCLYGIYGAALPLPGRFVVVTTPDHLEITKSDLARVGDWAFWLVATLAGLMLAGMWWATGFGGRVFVDGFSLILTPPLVIAVCLWRLRLLLRPGRLLLDRASDRVYQGTTVVCAISAIDELVTVDDEESEQPKELILIFHDEAGATHRYTIEDAGGRRAILGLYTSIGEFLWPPKIPAIQPGEWRLSRYDSHK
jgi:hypothetical protein